MKKVLSLTLALVMIAATLFALPFTSQAADVPDFSGKVVNVTSYNELKAALENAENADATIRLTQYIGLQTTGSAQINITAGPMLLDLNGFTFFVDCVDSNPSNLFALKSGSELYVINSGAQGYIEYCRDFYNKDLETNDAFSSGYAGMPSVFYVEGGAKLHLYNVAVYYNDELYGVESQTASGQYQGNCIRSIGSARVELVKSRLYNRAYEGQGIYAQFIGNTTPGYAYLSGGSIIETKDFGITSTSSNYELHLNECTVSGKYRSVYCSGKTFNDIVDLNLVYEIRIGEQFFPTSLYGTQINSHSADEGSLTVEVSGSDYECCKFSYEAMQLSHYGGHMYFCYYCGGGLRIADHNLRAVSTTATCTRSGIAKYKCTDCSYTRSQHVPALGHSTVIVPAKAATCTSEGSNAYYKCTRCTGLFKDAAATQKTTAEEEVVAKTTHTYKDVVTVATTSKDGKVESKCSVCGNISKTTPIYAAKSVTLSKTAYTYTGKALKPAVTVKDSKGNVIDAKYYTVKYTNNKKVGKATVTITLKGNYSGTLKATFKINPKATTLSSVTANSKGFTAKWKKQSTQTTGYQIQYSTSKKFTSKTTKTVTVKDAKTLTKTISKLKANTKYYVRVRTYKTVSKVNYYSSWSKAKTVTTKK